METEQNGGNISDVLARIRKISEYVDTIKANTEECLQEIQDQIDSLQYRNSRFFYEVSEELYVISEAIEIEKGFSKAENARSAN